MSPEFTTSVAVTVRGILKGIKVSKAAGVDHLAAGVDHLAAGVDHLAAGVDHLAAGVDHLAAGVDHLAAGVDHLAAGVDHLAAEHFVYSHCCTIVLVSMLFTDNVRPCTLHTACFYKNFHYSKFKNKISDTRENNNYKPIAINTVM